MKIFKITIHIIMLLILTQMVFVEGSSNNDASGFPVIVPANPTVPPYYHVLKGYWINAKATGNPFVLVPADSFHRTESEVTLEQEGTEKNYRMWITTAQAESFNNANIYLVGHEVELCCYWYILNGVQYRVLQNWNAK